MHTLLYFRKTSIPTYYNMPIIFMMLVSELYGVNDLRFIFNDNEGSDVAGAYQAGII